MIEIAVAGGMEEVASGILFATTITVFLVPASYMAAEEIKARLHRAWAWYRRPFQREDA